MVSLASPFILCPLAESKEFLGFSKGAAENQVVLTLGKNIAILYSVPDQKQETSWATSRHWFTSKVVYCEDFKKYGAVLDENSVLMWDENDTAISNPTKLKFPVKLQELIPTEKSGTLLMLQSGYVLPYMKAVADKGCSSTWKKLVNNEEWKILDYKLDENRNKILIVVGQKGEGKTRSKAGREKQNLLKVYISHVPFGGDIQSDVDEDVREYTIKCGSDRAILGWTLMLTDMETSVLYLSSDGFLYKYILEGQTTSAGLKPIRESLKLAMFDKYVSLTNPVVLFQHDETSIICYGSDSGEEGAMLFIYDVKYDLVLCRQSLKLYASPPIVSKLSSSVLIPSGLNVLVVGVRSNKTLLSSVVGRHRLQQIDFYETKDPWRNGWEGCTASEFEEGCKKNLSTSDYAEPSQEASFGVDLEDLQGMADALERNGHPEALICAQIIPQAIDAKLNRRSVVVWALDYFTDIPERNILMLIMFLLPEADTLAEENKEPLFRLLRKTFNRNTAIKTIGNLEFGVAKKLVAILVDLLENMGITELSDAENLIRWLGTLLDGQYTNYLFNNEVESIESVLKVINEKLAFLDDVASFAPLIDRILHTRKLQPKPSHKRNYRVDRVTFK